MVGHSQKKASPYPTEVIQAGELGNPFYRFMLSLLIFPQTSTSSSEKTWEVKFLTEKLGHAAKEFHNTDTDQFKLLIT